MTQNELELQEWLDAQDPLRHLRADDQDDGDKLLPPQASSIEQQITKLTFGPVQLNINVDSGPGCGGVTWSAGEVLSNYLATRGQSYLQGKHVLELGSGTGLVGLVAAKSGARKVTITDQLPLVGIMKQNVVSNNLEDLVTVIELDWGMPLSPLEQVDLILAADCVYFEPTFPLLVQTLDDLSAQAGSSCEILFCYQNRRKADKRFFTLLKKKFQWNNVDDPGQNSYSRRAISLLRLTRKGACSD